MKKAIFPILLLLSTVNVFAQQAKLNIKVLHARDSIVKIQVPVDDTWFFPAIKEVKFGADSTLSYSLNINKIAWLKINNSTVLIEPGTTNLVFDKGALIQSDRNLEGMLLFGSRNNDFYQNIAKTFYKKDSTAAGLNRLLEEDKNKTLQPYTELHAKQKISGNFYNEIKRYLSTEQVIMQAAIPMIVLTINKKVNDDLDKMWADAYKKHPLNNIQDAFYPDFYFHARYYANTYLNYYLPLKKGIKPTQRDETEYIKSMYKNFETNFTGKVKEYLLATYLYEEMMQADYQNVLVDLFAAFRSSYPKSNFSPYLQPLANKIIAYQTTVKKSFEGDQKFVANYSQLNSLDSLMGKFKGKTVFVDIWATWCGPCKAEFEYGKELAEFLRSKNVEMLFISMDNDAADQKWKEMIKYYKLAGNHIRTNQSLQKDMVNKLWGGKGYAIPRYLIIKDGKLVVDNALRPSDKEKLYAQISGNL